MQEADTAAERLGRFLRERRESHGWVLEALGKRAGFNRSYLSKIERAGLPGGRMEVPPVDTLRRIALAYQLPLEDLLAVVGSETPSPSPSPSFEDALQEYLMRRPIEVPVVEHPAHAGHSGSAVIDYVYVDRPSGVDKELLCIPVKGDCMAPRVQPGDRVIVERERWPEQGEMVVAVVNEEVYLRRFYKTNSHIILKADNPSYPDLEVTEADIVGVVVQAIWKP